MQKAIEILQKYASDSPLAVGVSGGADSMTLLHVVLSCPFIKRDNITVLHIDHNLRQTSRRDRLLVESFCNAQGLEIRVFEPHILKMAKENKRSIETEARVFRHSVFREFCLERGANLLLAHNADDNAETILMHIFRGCGIDGLRGMTCCDLNDDVGIIRPLISYAKSEIYFYAQQNKIVFFEDETNNDLRFNRNFVRSLMQEIETRYPTVRKAINRLSSLAVSTQDYIYSKLKPEYFVRQKEAVLLNKDALDSPLAAHYVIAAVKAAGLKSDLSSAHIEAVLGLSQAGKRVELPRGMVAFSERKDIEFCFVPQAMQNEIPFYIGENIFGNMVICAEKTDLGIKKGEIKVDADKMLNAVIRFRRDGDIFFSCGGRNKKLKKYLNEKKISNRVKGFLPLICRGNEVLAIVGIELSEHVKITSETKRAIRIYVKEN